MKNTICNIKRIFYFLSYSNLKEFIPSIKRENILWDRLEAANKNRMKHIEECGRLQERVRVLEHAIRDHKKSKTSLLKLGGSLPQSGTDIILWRVIE